MSDPSEFANGRILIIDDNPAIHRDFEKVLLGEPPADHAMSDAERVLFAEAVVAPVVPRFELTFAHAQQAVGAEVVT